MRRTASHDDAEKITIRVPDGRAKNSVEGGQLFQMNNTEVLITNAGTFDRSVVSASLAMENGTSSREASLGLIQVRHCNQR